MIEYEANNRPTMRGVALKRVPSAVERKHRNDYAKSDQVDKNGVKITPAASVSLDYDFCS